MAQRGLVERYEQPQTLARVRANFQRLVPLLRAEGQRLAVVDGTTSIDAVHAAVVAQVMDLKPSLF